MSRSGGFLALIGAALLIAACGSSTSTATSPATVPRCGVTIDASQVSVPATGGSGRLTVTTARECAWAASTTAGWLTIRGSASGQGDGAVEYVVAANPDPSTRTGSIDLNNQRAQVTQAAGQCTMQLRDTSASFTNAGGTGTIGVTASSAQCQWTAVPDSPWITVRGGATGSGNGTVTFEVAAASGPPRTGTIVVAGLRFAVTQAEGCTFAVSPTTFPVGPSGGSTTVSVATGAACPWTAASNVDWVSVANGTARTGPGTVLLSVAGTAGPTRIGSAIVAGQAIAVTQSPGCSYSVSPSAFTFDAGGGAGTVTIDASAGCGWAASTDASWVAFTGTTSGSGAGAVSFTIPAATGSARSGSLVVAGRTIAITQSEGCTFGIAPEGQAFDPAGGEVNVTVSAPAGCSWTASSNASWITIVSGASGSGPGTVKLAIEKMTGGPRTGTATIAGRTFTVTQSGGGDTTCSFGIAPADASIAAAGGTASVAVSASSGCAWATASSVPWITVTSGASGSGNGTVQLAIATNSGSARSGAVTVAGKTFTVNQAAAATACSYTINPTDSSQPASGGAVTVTVKTDGSCAWTAASTVPWITVASGDSSGSGNGPVHLDIAANPGGARTGTVQIAGQTFTVNQAAAAPACAYSISPADVSLSGAAATTAVGVTAGAACTWTANSNASWITVTAGASGSGSGTVQLAVAENPGNARSGSVTIAGQTFTVNQGTTCTYSLAGSGRNVPGKADEYMLDVTTRSTCSWTATSSAPWLVITAGSGTGSGTILYRVAENMTGSMRDATIAVMGQTFVVSQNK